MSEREKRGELPFLLKTGEPTDTISKLISIAYKTSIYVKVNNTNVQKRSEAGRMLNICF